MGYMECIAHRYKLEQEAKKTEKLEGNKKNNNESKSDSRNKNSER